MTKHLLIGLGAVGKSFLRILVEQGLFDKEAFFCVDDDQSAERAFISLGGLSSHFMRDRFTKDSYIGILSKYDKGDFVFDFANDIKDLEILEYSLKKGIHYLSLSDSNWIPNDPSWFSAHQHYLEYKKIKKHAIKNGVTSIVEFGMNPGLVSCFAKKCLEQIVNTEQNPFFQDNRKKLQDLIKRGRYDKVAKIIGVRLVVEVDHDNQSFAISAEEGCIYSPWSPSYFFHEYLSAPEIVLGTRKEYYQFQEVRDCNSHDHYVSLPFHGIDCKETVFSPQGMIEGSLITHEEIYSISELLSVGFYKPTVFFVYCPSRIAEKSIQDNRNSSKLQFKLLERKELLSGGESVGIIMQGERFRTAYYGNYLDSKSLIETPTVLQVSASAFAAYKYICNHPYEGVLFPEDLDADEVLKTAGIYLGENLFMTCPDIVPRYNNNTIYSSNVFG